MYHFVIILCMLAWQCHAHTYLTHLTINGTKLEELRCTLPLWDNENYPVLDPSSDDLRCKTSDMQSTKTETCWVPAGSKVTLHMTESGGESRFISPSHRGPILTYMAPLESNGEGNVWFKIYEDGYDGDSDVWAVDKIVKAKGYWDVTIPSDIAPGDYLLRGEVIALHEADRVYGADDSAGAQYYPGCARIHVTGTGTAKPPGVPIPGAYKPNDPGIHYNLWDGLKTYTIPGPPVYIPGASGGSVAANAAAASVVESNASAPTVPSPSSSSSSSSSSSNPGSNPGSCLSKRGKKRSRRSRRRSRKAKRHQEI